MQIDDRFPTKLPSVLDAPDPFRSALADSISSQESIRLVIHAPALSTLGERTPATVLAVTDKGWLIVSETWKIFMWAMRNDSGFSSCGCRQGMAEKNLRSFSRLIVKE